MDFGKILEKFGVAKIKNVLIPDVQNCRQDFSKNQLCQIARNAK